MSLEWPLDDSFIDQVYQLNKKGRYEEACDRAFNGLASFFNSIGQTYSGNNILLFGSSRVGKSLLAEALSHRIDAPVVDMDEFRRFYWHPKNRYKEIRDIAACRCLFYAELMRKLPAGVIFEGSDFYFSIMNGDFDVKEPFFGFILGVKSEDIERKAEQIHSASLAGKCRTKKSFEKSVELANSTYKASKLMMNRTKGDERFFYLNMMAEQDILASVAASVDACVNIISPDKRG